ncbi:glycosyltransferase family 2 protein [Nocardioides ferulae]|uniref:glycosyltransferase family 2 protein n=1 Tax=Nocardioides ferulae TaxID=2340821 RepID=UPI000EAE529A|nr:glycosyltransferase family 2 protein [Nocardioides ferulae]
MTDQPSRAPRIVAVVVTFNRLELLQGLVARLREIGGVSGLDEVLVVDNASTDGTGEWLAGLDAGLDASAPQLVEPVPVLGRTLAENRGGAGGFHDGLAWAVERGADLVWLMDDDGLPAPDCLERLLAVPDLDFWGPAVVDRDDPGRLVFPIRLPGGTRVVHRIADVEAATVDGLIRDVVIPFNGVLVTRELVQRIGLPREEYFLWGDDHEYRLRAERAGGRIATVVGARVHHPSVGELGTPMMFGRTTYNHSPSDLKHYCMARNNLLNLRDYRGWPHALAFVAKTVWFYLVTRPRPGRLLMSFRGMIDGLRGDFTGHRRYLR